MAAPDTRALTAQLAEDLSWLEEHCRQHPEQAAHAGELRLAASLVRNCIGPHLDEQAPSPLHIAVVGGAGTGKSTLVNLLSGTVAAEANPQAGFTRHPIAYTNMNGVLSWPGHVGFLGPLQRLTEPCPANLDEDVYQVRHITIDSGTGPLLTDVVIWDCPDMTTWAATHYVSRLLEVSGLADVILYAASDERYNDEAPSQFLNLLLRCGKPVIVCLMKMKEENATALVAHFQQEVLNRMPSGAVNCLAIPYLTSAQLAAPGHLAERFRMPLLNQVAALVQSPAEARLRTVRGAMKYLSSAHENLLGVARHDVAALQGWRAIVQAGQVEFDNRYRREYLTGERFRAFDEALVRLLDLLELPGVGKVVSNALWVMRTPYRLVRGWVDQTLKRPASRSLPERPVLEEALTGWLESLHKEAVHRSDSHPLWAHIETGFNTGLVDLTHKRFEECLRDFQLNMANEIEKTARAIYEELEKSPVTLNMFRTGKFTLDLAAIGAALTIGHLGVHDFILVPLAASISHQLVELLGRQYVDNQREVARHRQQALVTQYISGPLVEWLAEWPATGGSAYEKLQKALKRIPIVVKELETAVNKK